MSAPFSRRKVPFIAAAATVSWLLAAYFIQSAWSDRDAEELKLAQLDHEIADSKQKLVNHDLMLDQLIKMRTSLAQQCQRLPSRLDPLITEATLREQAAHARVEVTEFRFGAEQLHEGFYGETPVTLTVDGYAANFTAFMYKLLGASPIRRIATMKIVPISNSRVQARIVVMYDRTLIADDIIHIPQ